MNTWPIEPPARNDIHCEHCGREIQAVAVIYGAFEIVGVREYTWQHVDDGLSWCVRRFNARPYAAFAATRRVEEVRQR